MNQFEMKGKVEDDKLVKRLQEAAKVPLTSEERREQRISWVMSIIDNPDEETRKEVERVVDGVFK